MINLDPQTTADFWDAYLRGADVGTNLAQVSHTVPVAPQKPRSPVSGSVPNVSRIASAAIRFAWDLVLLPAPVAADAPPRVA